MSAPNGAEQQPVQASEVPSVWGYGEVTMADGTKKIVVQISTPVGIFIDFISPAAAVTIGQALAHLGRQATSGLILPPGIN